MKKVKKFMIFLAVFAIAVVSCAGLAACSKDNSWKEGLKTKFQAAKYLPDLNEIMPSSVTDKVDLDANIRTVNSNDIAPYQSVAKSSIYTDMTDYSEMNISSLSGEAVYLLEFEWILQDFAFIETMVTPAKTNSAGYLEQRAITAYDQWFDMGGGIKVKYGQIEGGLLFHEYRDNGSGGYDKFKAAVYDNGKTEMFIETHEIPGIYMSYDGARFIKIYMHKDSDGNFSYLSYFDFKKDGDNFEGVTVSLSSEEILASSCDVTYLKGDNDEFYMQSQTKNKDSGDIFVREILLKEDTAFWWFNNTNAAVSLNAFDGADKIYYESQGVLEKVFKGLKLSGNDVVLENVISEGRYIQSYLLNYAFNTSAADKMSEAVYFGKLELSHPTEGAAVTPLNYEDYLPNGLTLKSGVNFDFEPYADVNSLISNYKIAAVPDAAEIKVFDNHTGVLEKCGEFITAQSYAAP